MRLIDADALELVPGIREMQGRRYVGGRNNGKTLLTLAAFFQNKIDDAPTVDATPQWISVENPPKESGEYIVVVQLPNGTKDRRWDIYHPDAGWCEDCSAKVLFWMSFDSLPEPPITEEE